MLKKLEKLLIDYTSGQTKKNLDRRFEGNSVLKSIMPTCKVLSFKRTNMYASIKHHSRAKMELICVFDELFCIFEFVLISNVCISNACSINALVQF